MDLYDQNLDFFKKYWLTDLKHSQNTKALCPPADWFLATLMKMLPFALSGLLLAPLAAETTAPHRIHVDASASTGGDGTSWATAFNSLQDALAAAGLTVGDDEIWVASGTYTPDPGGTDKTRKFQLANGVAIYGGFAGTESTLGERNPDPATNGTVLSGDLLGDDGANFTNRTDNSNRVVDGTGTDATAILDGVTIQGGKAPSKGGGFGGGSPTFVRCVFTGNESTNDGGAAALPSGSAPHFEDCQFLANRAGRYGGAIDAYYAPATFLRCRFEGNTAVTGAGAVMNYVSDTRFSSCSFRGNTATNGSGGGLGGAMYLWGGISMFQNCEITGNDAGYGGGLYLLVANAVLTNVTITGNQGYSGGGGIHCGYQASSPSFTNCVVWNNASSGSNTEIVASISKGTSNPTFSHCIVQHSAGSGPSWNTAAGSDGGSNADDDPVFTTAPNPLSAPSTAGDFSLDVSSPAIDAGLDTADLDGSGAGTDTVATISEDLAGNPRFEGTTIDIGAYEYFEGSVAVTFASLFPGLDASGDDNGNGLSNFGDYALGADPTAPHDPAMMPSIAPGSVTFGHRGGTSDVNPVYKKSSTLDGWTPMQPGIDYNVISSETVGDRIVVTLELLIDSEANPKMFFVQEFPEP